MSNTVAEAFSDNEMLQIVLNDRVSSTGLTVPIPAWFSNLRLATKDLGRPSIDDAVCHALAQYVRKINEARVIKANAQAQIEIAEEEAEKAIEAAKKRTTNPDIEKHLFAAETKEKIWRKYANQKTQLSASTEKRIVVVHDMLKKDVESLGKRLESLEGKLKETWKDGDEDAVKKIAGDVSKARDEVEEAEKKRVELLGQELSVLQARSTRLQGEKQKLELQLLDANTHGFTPDTERVEALEVELGILRVDHDILGGEKYSLEDKCVRLHKDHAELEVKHTQLDKEHAVLEVKHSELQEKYGKAKSALDRAVDIARSNKSRVSMVNGATKEHRVRLDVDQGKKRAAPEDLAIGSVEKRAKTGMEAPKEIEPSQKTMAEVKKRIEMENRPETQS